MIIFWRLCTCAFLGIYGGCSASDEAALDSKLAELVSKGLLSEEKLAKLKRQLLEESSDDESDASLDSSQEVGEESQSSSPPSSKHVDVETPKSEKPADAGHAAGKPRRPQSMEESMRAFGVDPDAIAKLGQRRKPTDINEFVAAAMQAASAQETARTRDLEVLEDHEDAWKEKELLDDAVHVESEGEGTPETHDRPTQDLGKVLPGSVQDKLAGIMAKFEGSLDPEASSLMAQLLGSRNAEGDEKGSEDEEEDDDGSTEDLAGLLASVNAGGRGVTGLNAELEELERERKATDERMEKAAVERRAEMERRQEKRELEHKKFEEEMAEKEEQRKKDRAEFDEGRKRHAEYMQKMEDRKKQAEERREEMEQKREARQDRMAEAMKMAGAEIAQFEAMKEAQRKKQKEGVVRDDL